MAHKKAGGSSRNGRDSHSQRLGLKIFGGEQALAGNIIARQRGTKWHPGEPRHGAHRTLNEGGIFAVRYSQRCEIRERKPYAIASGRSIPGLKVQFARSSLALCRKFVD